MSKALLSAAIFLLLASALAKADGPEPQPETEQPSASERGVNEAQAISGWSWHGQATTVSQGHGDFSSPYSGPSSFRNGADYHTSFTATGFFGRTLWKDAELYFNPEASAGSGMSSSEGIAAFPNGEAYRVGTPKPQISIARLYWKQTIALGEGRRFVEDDLNAIASYQPESRLTFILGHFSLPDFLDGNSYAHDPRTQFMNWGVWENGAWDYPADTKGYTNAFFVELNEPSWALRFALAMEPKEAAGMALDSDLNRAHGSTLEFEKRYTLGDHPGRTRVLGYANRANMGNFRDTIGTPAYDLDITQSRQASEKYGFGINLEQEVATGVGAFLRAGYNDGHTESWAFTEIDQTLSFGMSVDGSRWGRVGDLVGAAYVMDGISRDHRDYLADGGKGFMLGDGALNYGYEKVAEAFYLVKIVRHFGATLDFQYVTNPGYNRDRGPVLVSGIRLHVEI